jgi:hypothetical protein
VSGGIIKLNTINHQHSGLHLNEIIPLGNGIGWFLTMDACLIWLMTECFQKPL